MSATRIAGGARERGSALVVVLMAVLLVSALSAAVVLLAMTETLAAANERAARATLYAAEAGIELALADLMLLPGWDDVLAGAARSGRVDGPPSGTRQLADGRTIDLGRIVNLASCGLPAACSDAALDLSTAARPWGRNNPRWRPFAFGPLASGGGPAIYVVVLVGDDPSENDADPARDGLPPGNPGAGVILLRAEGFGPSGAHRVVEAAVVRSPGGTTAGPGAAAFRVLSWREVR